MLEALFKNKSQDIAVEHVSHTVILNPHETSIFPHIGLQNILIIFIIQLFINFMRWIMKL